MAPIRGNRIKRTTTLRGLSPDPVRDRLQWISHAIENEVAAVTMAPLGPNVAAKDGGSLTCAFDKTSVAEV